jgi:hypothetical protein
LEIQGTLCISWRSRTANKSERYGKYESVHNRFMRWANSGVWERIFHGPASGRFAAPEGRSRDEQETGFLKSALALRKSAKVLDNFSGREL